jgi:hypothetical protein
MNSKFLFSLPLSFLLLACQFQVTSYSNSSLNLESTETSQTSQNTSNTSTTIPSSQPGTDSGATTTSQTTNSTSSSTSYSPPLLPGEKIDFDEISTLIAHIADAQALGVRKRLLGQSNQFENPNYIVKSTETYNPNVSITEESTVEVNFSRLTEVITEEPQTGFETYVATADSITINRLVNDPGRIVIETLNNYQYRLMDGSNMLIDWQNGDGSPLEFIFNEALELVTVESRSLNASITFVAFEDYVYSIQGGFNSIFENVRDNVFPDINTNTGMITIEGLVEHEVYDVAYEGYRLVQTITQDEIDGQVDKLYVIYQYTFVSFVPSNLSNRPDETGLVYDEDGVATYDKTGYFSDTTRQSFIINNNTGLIYKIENVTIERFQGGIVFLADSDFPFDVRILENGDLEFYPLYTNESIIFFEGFKDKYGNKYILNNRINEYDEITQTYFYVYDMNLPYEFYQEYPHHLLDVRSYTRPLAYWLLDNGEVLKVTFTSTSWVRNVWLDDIRIMGEQGQTRSITQEESHLVIASKLFSYRHDFRPFKVEYGKVFSETYSNNRWENGVFAQYGMFIVFDAFTKRDFILYTYHDNIPAWNINYLKQHDVLLEFSQGNIIYFKGFTKYFSDAIDHFLSVNQFQGLGSIMYLNFQNSYLNIPQWFKDNYADSLSYETVISNVGIEQGKAVQYGINSNTYYDIVAEVIDGSLEITAHESGTYIAPTVSSITLQPINR